MLKTGIILTNTGTPDAPTSGALRKYLREFLSDPRVVQIPRIIWLPILYGLVLTLRPKKSARLYKKIWTHAGSPMRVFLLSIQKQLQHKLGENYRVELGMNYGQPSIANSIKKLRDAKVDRIIILPLFPQYSDTSTGSSYDRVKAALSKWPAHPEVNNIHTRVISIIFTR
jgi:ferrochelatase